MALTLVSSTAQEGHRFTFLGANKGSECEGCPFTRLCFGLQPGQTYEVRRFRDVVHPCNLHDPGKVRVAEVEPVAFRSTVETRLLRGTAAAWNPVDCGMPECANWGLCHPVGPEAGARHAIVGVEEPVDCPMGHDITAVRLERA